MAAYAALVSLMNNIQQMMNHPRLSTSFDRNHIQYLVEKAGLLLDMIEGNNYGGGSKEAEDLERHIASAAHAAEDVIESRIVDQIHALSAAHAAESAVVDGETSSSFLLNVQKKMKKKVRYLKRRVARAAHAHAAEDMIESNIVDQVHDGSNQASLSCSLHLPQIIEDMDAILKRANELKEKENWREEQPTQSTRELTESGETAMVGFDDELIQLMDELTSQQSSRHIISIVGMGGMGKTTLAKNIYANPLIIEHFDIRAWATISQHYNVEGIFSQLLSDKGNSAGRSVDGLGEELHKTLTGRSRRYLIILDDLWSVEAWDKVWRFFPDNGNRSRVVLTTRLSNVASVCGSSCFTMNLLDEDKSWKLFCQKAFFPREDDPRQLESVGKEIVRSCKGLALSIVVIGGLLLKSPRTIEFWEDVAKSMKSNPESRVKRESLDILCLSYNHLPPHLKPCFLYMGAFEEDSEIRVSNITKLWVAEGFIKPNGTQGWEEIAGGYLKDLIERNLILVGRRRCNGKAGSCGIHDLLRDLCVKVAEQEEFFHVKKEGSQIRGTERRLVCGGYQEPIAPSLARSIMRRTFLGQHSKCGLLRVLNVASYESLEEVYDKVNARYLVYQQSFHLPLVQRLPTSLSLIWNLQTLIVKGYSHSPVSVAPPEIWKMRQLRHVECKHIYLPDPPPTSTGQDEMLILDNLQTLTTVVNLRLCNIIPNIKKLHLVYDGELAGYDDSLIECLCNLDRLHKLESLKMEIKGSRWPSPVPELNRKLAFPSSLNKLSLSWCQLHWDDLTMIGSLPLLEVLILEEHAVYEGEKWSPVNGQFLKLKYLKIRSCRLICWDADNSHFPVLEKLLLNYLWDLEEIPLDMGDIPTLGLIGVDCCSNSAAISAMRIKEDQAEKENDGLQIQVRVSDLHLERFKKILDAEGLTLNNIQFATPWSKDINGK